MGVLSSLGFGVTMYGAMNVNTLTAVAADAILSVFLVGAAGAVVAVVLNRGGTAEA